MTPVTKNDMPLVAVLAETTARMLHWSQDLNGQVAGGGKAGEHIWHGAQIDLEMATEVLLGLGVTATFHNAANFQLLMDVNDVHAHVLALSPDQIPPLDKVISAFIGVADLRGLIDTSHEAVFEPSSKIRQAMDALSDAGFAEQDGGLFAWREKIRPAMRLQHLWPIALPPKAF